MRLCLIMLILLVSGCAASHYSPGGCNINHCFKIPDVPFIEQKNDFCGPASMAIIMNFYDVNITQEEIAKEIYSLELKGTLSLALAMYPVTKGFEADMYNGNLDDLKQRLRERFPLIVSVMERANKDRAHYMVVWGYDDLGKLLYVHSGVKDGMNIAYSRFMDMWKRSDYLTFRIYPKGSGIK